ncbi:hypothetical protein NJC38_21975 [Pseudomonas sp. 21LCFQ010]|uniref:hypothetical protein n=1 Tax=Pseudomonas sp. 21LCFQ010 TaxID=2957506 RepID=UPI002097E3C4|nr:hypothetical protein [Pseudomonas sp. 21LCFQ010]MCO8164810.1 hypothetical protein [Pseudomonas sp. 21LCFQ010]
MDTSLVGMNAYGTNGVHLGQMCSDRCIRKDGVVIFRIIDFKVYSMHSQCLGRYANGVGTHWGGAMIFSLLEGDDLNSNAGWS